MESLPPQIIISLPVHAAVWPNRGMGAFIVLVGVQLSLAGLYRPPVFKMQLRLHPEPPQTTISVPVHTAVCKPRAAGTSAVLVAVQTSVIGLYRPPLLRFTTLESYPPQIINSAPVHTDE